MATRAERRVETRTERRARKLDEFRETLVDPDHIPIRRKDARLMFSLTNDDLKTLDFIEKESPFDEGTESVRQYMLPDVVVLAKVKWEEGQLLTQYKDYLDGKVPTQGDREKIYGLLKPKPYWYSAPSTTTVEGRQSVQQGLISNTCICVVKAGVWAYTGSHVIFADLMHSCADVANYAYRLFTLPGAQQRPDHSHPYGYAPIRYITADRSFVILGGLGFVVPFWASASELVHVWKPADHLSEAVSTHSSELMFVAPAAIFLASIALEGIAVRTAFREILAQAPAGQTWGRSDLRRCSAYVREGPEIMSVATITEAGSGVLGAGVGLLGLGLTWYFESAVFDIATSLVMSSIVGAVSIFLLSRSSGLLLGRTLPLARVEHLVGLLEAQPAIVAVYDVKTEIMGTDTLRFKAEVQFNPQTITESLLQAVEDLQRSPRQASANPEALSRHQLVRRRLVEQFSETLPRLREAHASRETAEDWLFENNGVFYEALAWETKHAEWLLRHELDDFRNVHIDLEPW